LVPLCEESRLQKILESAGASSAGMVSMLYRQVIIVGTQNHSLGKDLYNLIWQPLEPYLAGIKKINYSPSGKLYSIAFHSLPYDSKKILADKYQLQQYTSTRELALRTVDQITKPKSISLFGDANFSMDSVQLMATRKIRDTVTRYSTFKPTARGINGSTWPPLEGTAEEVKKIGDLFKNNKINSQSFTGSNASEENFKQLSGRSPQVIHIATHGFFLPDPALNKRIASDKQNIYTLANDPMLRSGLILSGGNYAWSGKTAIPGVEDGIVTAYEISQMDLSNTELVILSACETALGDVKGSEGVFGLQRAFKMAGVKRMIVSLWKVPDKETSELMTAFYKYWFDGKSIENAFAQAQSEMRKKYDPYYWAAFVLIE
jgi:CHAT domain-containing protein